MDASDQRTTGKSCGRTWCEKSKPRKNSQLGEKGPTRRPWSLGVVLLLIIVNEKTFLNVFGASALLPHEFALARSWSEKMPIPTKNGLRASSATLAVASPRAEPRVTS